MTNKEADRIWNLLDMAAGLMDPGKAYDLVREARDAIGNEVADKGADRIQRGHICEHGIRWPHACQPCDDAAWTRHSMSASEPNAGCLVDLPTEAMIVAGIAELDRTNPYDRDVVSNIWIVMERAKGMTIPSEKALANAQARVKGLESALGRVLPYTEAERLAESAAVRCGKTRDPINKAVLAARRLLAQGSQS